VLSTRKALVTALTAMLFAFGLSVTTAMAATRPSAPATTSPLTTASVSALSGGQARLTSYATAQQPAAVAVFKHCTTGSSGGNITTCFTIYHNGRYVRVMRLSACVHHTQRHLFLDIIGPHNAPLAGNDLPGFWISPGSCDIITYHPFHTVPAGTYCGHTYRVSGTQLALIAKVCAKL